MIIENDETIVFDTVITDNSAAIAYDNSTGETITASSPILSGQMSGNALLDLAASPGAPVTIELVNTTGNPIFAGATSVSADLTIIRANS